MKKALFAIGLLSIATFGSTQTKWNIDKSHSNIRFTVVHMLISEVDGEFNEFDGSVTSKSDDFNGATIEFSANTASVDTKNERRDNHLKSDDFFNAESFPKISFKGKLEKEGKNYFLVGDLTMRDVTKKVKFETKYLGSMQNGDRGRKAGFKITGTVNRFDYGLKWDRAVEAGGLVVGEDVEITCKIELNEVKAG